LPLRHSPLLAVASKTRGQGRHEENLIADTYGINCANLHGFIATKRHENAEKGQKNGQKVLYKVLYKHVR